MTTVSELIVAIGSDNRDLDRGLDNAEKSIEGFGKSASKSLRNVGAVMTAGVTVPLAGLGLAAVRTSISLESAFAGVVKTVDGTAQEMGVLRDELEGLATQGSIAALENAHEEIFAIAEAAGQLGIAREDVAEFTEVIAALGMTTDIAGEEGARALAQFANVTGLEADQYGALGDTIATLGNNMATTESQILSFGQRLGTISQLGFDQAEILAIGATLASVGISAELGSTNFVKGVDQMVTAAYTGGPELQTFADTAGLTADEFAELAKSDPAAAVVAFTEGLAQLDPAEQTQALEDIGLAGTEAQRVFKSLSGNTDLLRKALGLSEEAFAGNNALMTEAGVRADTTAGQINIFKNNATQLADNVGQVLLPPLNKLLSIITPMIQRLQDVNPRFIEAGVAVAIAAAAAGPAITAIGALGAAFGALLSPVGLAVIAVGAVGAAMAAGVQFDDVIAKLQGFKDTVTQTLQNVDWSGLSQVAIDAVATFVTDMGTALATMDQETFNEGLRKFFTVAWGTFTLPIQFGTWIGTNIVLPLGEALLNADYSQLTAGASMLGTALLQKISGSLIGWYDWAQLNVIMPIGEAIANADYDTLFEAIGNFGSELFGGLLDSLPDIAEWVGENILTPFITAVAALGNAVRVAINNAIPDSFGIDVPKIELLGKTIFEGGRIEVPVPDPFPGATFEARAMGGPVTGGNPYLVGEEGPELFVPGRSGNIVPNHALGGGSTNVYNITAYGQSPAEIYDLIRRESMNRSPG